MTALDIAVKALKWIAEFGDADSTSCKALADIAALTPVATSDPVWGSEPWDGKPAVAPPACAGCNQHEETNPPPHTIECNFQHFLSYSGFSNEPADVRAKLFKAYEANWTPAAVAKDDMRAAFEAWVIGEPCGDIRRNGDDYVDPETSNMWAGFKAGRASAAAAGEPADYETIYVPSLKINVAFPRAPIAQPVPQDRLDAERWRWLRNDSIEQWKHPIVVSQVRLSEPNEHMRYVGPLFGIALDSAIDAAILATKSADSAEDHA